MAISLPPWLAPVDFTRSMMAGGELGDRLNQNAVALQRNALEQESLRLRAEEANAQIQQAMSELAVRERMHKMSIAAQMAENASRVGLAQRELTSKEGLEQRRLELMGEENAARIAATNAGIDERSDYHRGLLESKEEERKRKEQEAAAEVADAVGFWNARNAGASYQEAMSQFPRALRGTGSATLLSESGRQMTNERAIITTQLSAVENDLRRASAEKNALMKGNLAIANKNAFSQSVSNYDNTIATLYQERNKLLSKLSGLGRANALGDDLNPAGATGEGGWGLNLPDGKNLAEIRSKMMYGAPYNIPGRGVMIWNGEEFE